MGAIDQRDVRGVCRSTARRHRNMPAPQYRWPTPARPASALLHLPPCPASAVPQIARIAPTPTGWRPSRAVLYSLTMAVVAPEYVVQKEASAGRVQRSAGTRADLSYTLAPSCTAALRSTVAAAAPAADRDELHPPPTTPPCRRRSSWWRRCAEEDALRGGAAAWGCWRVMQGACAAAQWGQPG